MIGRNEREVFDEIMATGDWYATRLERCWKIVIKGDAVYAHFNANGIITEYVDERCL